jgi:hypothetical protein
MPNPKGKPENLEPHKFKSDREKSLTEQLNIKITKETSERLILHSSSTDILHELQ